MDEARAAMAMGTMDDGLNVVLHAFESIAHVASGVSGDEVQADTFCAIWETATAAGSIRYTVSMLGDAFPDVLGPDVVQQRFEDVFWPEAQHQLAPLDLIAAAAAAVRGYQALVRDMRRSLIDQAEARLDDGDQAALGDDDLADQLARWAAGDD